MAVYRPSSAKKRKDTLKLVWCTRAANRQMYKLHTLKVATDTFWIFRKVNGLTEQELILVEVAADKKVK